MTDAPNETLNCDFDDGTFCNWNHTTFSLQDPSVRIPNGPLYDHTKKNYKGIFNFIQFFV